MNKTNNKNNDTELLELLRTELETLSKAHLRNYNKALRLIRRIKRENLCLSE
jgi:hypothetical protein